MKLSFTIQGVPNLWNNGQAWLSATVIAPKPLQQIQQRISVISP